MTLPGFAAEASTRRTATRYRAGPAAGTGPAGVLPAQVSFGTCRDECRVVPCRSVCRNNPNSRECRKCMNDCINECLTPPSPPPECTVIDSCNEFGDKQCRQVCTYSDGKQTVSAPYDCGFC